MHIYIYIYVYPFGVLSKAQVVGAALTGKSWHEVRFDYLKCFDPENIITII